MRFSAQLPTNRVEHEARLLSAGAIAEMARAIEAAGFDACYVTEHPFPPDAWLEAGGHHALDPFVALSAVAVATGRLRLHMNVLVLAYRNPFLAAKAIASLDVLSEGRVILGIAAGYLEEEYRALGADFVHRNEVTDEALAALKLALMGDSVRLSGRGYEARGNTMLPRPVQRPHPPIWIGGNSRVAMRRAAEHAQGWSPFALSERFSSQTRTAAIGSLDELREKLAYLRDYAAKIGREEDFDICFVPFGRAMNAEEPPDQALLDQIGELEEIGVTWLSVGFASSSRERHVESVQRFGEEIIAKLH